MVLPLVAVCGGAAEEAATPTPTATQAATATPTPTEAESGEPASDVPMDIAELLREKTMRLWDVYNVYGIDTLSTFYEENYWAAAEVTRSNMQVFKLRG